MNPLVGTRLAAGQRRRRTPSAAHSLYSTPCGMLQSVSLDDGCSSQRGLAGATLGCVLHGQLDIRSRNSTVGASRAIGWLAAAERRSSAVTSTQSLQLGFGLRWLTISSQSAGRGSGHAARIGNAGSSPSARRRLDQGHSSARRTSLAIPHFARRSGLPDKNSLPSHRETLVTPLVKWPNPISSRCSFHRLTCILVIAQYQSPRKRRIAVRVNPVASLGDARWCSKALCGARTANRQLPIE